MVTDQTFQAWVVKFALSASSGGIAESVTFPFDLTKTRLQIQGEVASNYSNGSVLVKRRMFRTAYHIAIDEGFTKLWSGLTPALYRQFIYTGCKTEIYEFLRDHVLGKNQDGEFSVLKSVIAGAMAGASGQFIACPLDLVKVKMQMVNQKRHLPYNHVKFLSVSHALKCMYESGGVKRLWAGWVPSVTRAALVNMGHFATYEKVKHDILKRSSLKDGIVCWSLASLCSGIAIATISTPADVVKTRIMNQNTDSKGKFLFYKSSFNCFIKTAKHEGFLSLYKGFFPISLRVVPWNIIFWNSYELFRNWFGVSTF